MYDPPTYLTWRSPNCGEHWDPGCTAGLLPSKSQSRNAEYSVVFAESVSLSENTLLTQPNMETQRTQGTPEVDTHVVQRTSTTGPGVLFTVSTIASGFALTPCGASNTGYTSSFVSRPDYVSGCVQTRPCTMGDLALGQCVAAVVCTANCEQLVPCSLCGPTFSVCL